MAQNWIYLRVGIGLALVIVLVWHHYDAVILVDQLNSLQVTWIILAGLSIFLATVLGGFNAHIIVSRDGKLPLLRFLPLYWTAWAVSLVVPGQVGDVASLTAMLRRDGFQWHASLGRVLLDKIISLVVISLFALWGLVSVINPRILYVSNLGLILVGLLVVAIVLYLLRSYLSSIFDPQKSGWRGFIGRAITELASTVCQYPKRVLLNFVLTCAKIGLIGFSYWCMFSAFGQTDLSVWQVIVLAAASSLVAYIPISFNGIGTVEITGIFLFVKLGVPEVTTLSVYLALRLVVFTLAWVPAVVWFVSGWKKASYPSYK